MLCSVSLTHHLCGVGWPLAQGVSLFGQPLSCSLLFCPSFHPHSSSFLLMALFNFINPLFGLPFVTASLPHSPQFAAALTVMHPPAPSAQDVDTDPSNACPSHDVIAASPDSQSSVRLSSKNDCNSNME